MRAAFPGLPAPLGIPAFDGESCEKRCSIQDLGYVENSHIGKDVLIAASAAVLADTSMFNGQILCRL